MFNIFKSLTSLAKATPQQQQQLRWMHYRKSPSVPRAKSKRFYVHVKKERDPEEVALSRELWTHYKANMRSVYQLFKAEYKFVGKESEKARLEKQAIADREANLLLSNDEANKKIFELQMADLKMKLKNEAELKQQKLIDMKKKEELYKEAAERRVQDIEEKARHFIDPKNLEYEIEKMLDERVDYNFFIDKNGVKFRNNTRLVDTKNNRVNA